jgi:2-phosphosulfolactate phosphatase
MKFNYTSLETCHTANGLVIVIDVLRAFSTAAYAFSRGAKKIILASTVEEALGLKIKRPTAKVMGEVGGLPPAGFDFGNSPTQILEEDLNGLTLIQRTSAGTQGAVRCVNANRLLAASFVVAGATVKHVLKIEPSEVVFVITGGNNNEEDLSCAEYLEALLKGQNPGTKSFMRRVYDSRDAKGHLDPTLPEFPESDLDYCTQISRFNFSMPITRENAQLVMRAIQP